jgi:hypothetical protein
MELQPQRRQGHTVAVPHALTVGSLEEVRLADALSAATSRMSAQ